MFRRVNLQMLATAASILSAVSACSDDNVLRALKNPRHSDSASAFCSSFIQSTIVPYTTTYYISVLSLVYITPSITSTVTEIVTVQALTTVYTSGAVVKRDTSASLPSFVSQYPPSRIRSACSCFISPPPPTTAVSTSYGFVGVPRTVTLSPTAISTITVASTTTQYSTVTTGAPCGSPINGCIYGDSANLMNITDARLCQVYCNDFPCFSYSIGRDSSGDIAWCQLSGQVPTDAYDPTPTPPGPGVTGIPGVNEYCSSFWIYDRRCPYLAGKP